MLRGNTGDFGVPADCAHSGFLTSKDWEYDPDNNEFVRVEDSDGTFLKRFRRDMDYMKRTGDSIPCLHEDMEKNLPEGQKGQAHAIACPCPKCNPRC